MRNVRMGAPYRDGHAGSKDPASIRTTPTKNLRQMAQAPRTFAPDLRTCGLFLRASERIHLEYRAQKRVRAIRAVLPARQFLWRVADAGHAGHKDHAHRTELRHHLRVVRSEEHTSELQSLAYLVCRLLLE